MDGSNATLKHLIISKGIGIRLTTELNSSVIVFDNWVLIQPFITKMVIVVFLMNELEQLRSLRKSCKGSTDRRGHGGSQDIKAALAVTCLQNR